jgi:hypothetical protein
MHDVRDSAGNTIRFDVVEELLRGLEGEKAIDKTLISAEKLFVGDVSDRLIKQAKQRVTTLNKRYSQGEMKDNEAKVEISNILLALT